MSLGGVARGFLADGFDCCVLLSCVLHFVYVAACSFGFCYPDDLVCV